MYLCGCAQWGPSWNNIDLHLPASCSFEEEKTLRKKCEKETWPPTIPPSAQPLKGFPLQNQLQSRGPPSGWCCCHAVSYKWEDILQIKEAVSEKVQDSVRLQNPDFESGQMAIFFRNLLIHELGQFCPSLTCKQLQFINLVVYEL